LKSCGATDYARRTAPLAAFPLGKRQRPRHVVLQRLHIRPSRIPAAGSVTFTASASGRYPGWRPHAFCLPVRIRQTVASKTHARCESTAGRLPLRGQHRLSAASAACFPFNCICERICGHQTRAYDSTRQAAPALRKGPAAPRVSLTARGSRPKLARTLVLVCALVRMQLNGKQGAHLQRIGSTCAAPATVSEKRCQADCLTPRSRLRCPRARPRRHITTGRETTRPGRGSGAFASPDTGQTTKNDHRGDAAARS